MSRSKIFTKKIEEFLAPNGNSQNPLTAFTAKQNSRTTFGKTRQALTRVYRFYAGRVFGSNMATDEPVYKKQHAGVFDYLTLGFFYVAQIRLQQYLQETLMPRAENSVKWRLATAALTCLAYFPLIAIRGIVGAALTVAGFIPALIVKAVVDYRARSKSQYSEPLLGEARALVEQQPLENKNSPSSYAKSLSKGECLVVTKTGRKANANYEYQIEKLDQKMDFSKTGFSKVVIKQRPRINNLSITFQVNLFNIFKHEKPATGSKTHAVHRILSDEHHEQQKLQRPDDFQQQYLYIP